MEQVLRSLGRSPERIGARSIRSLDEAGLIAMARPGGCSLAFGELVRRHSKALTAFLLRLCRDPDRAEDLAQATLEAAFTHVLGFNGRSRFSTWLNAIAYREFLKSVRTSSRQSRIKDAVCAERPTQIAFDPGQAIDISAALDGLSSRERECVELCAIRGESHRDVSARLNIPVGTIKSHISRAREKLHRHLDMPLGE